MYKSGSLPRKGERKKWGENEDERRKVKMKVWIGAGI